MLKEIIEKLKRSPSFWQTGANYIERVWGFAYSLILARLILPDVFGVFVFGMGIAQVASLLTRWEIGNLIRSDTYYQEEGFDVAWALTKLLAIVEIIVIVAVAIVMAVSGAQIEVCIAILVCGCANALDKFSLLLKSDLEGRSNFKNNFKVKLCFPPAVAIITIPMAMMGFGIWALLASSWVGVSLNWVIFRKANPRNISNQRPSIELFKKVVQPSLWQWMNYICYTIFNRADKVLVGSLGSKESVGYYNRSFNYAPLSFMIFGAIAGVPAIVAFRDLKNHREKWKVFILRGSLLVGAGIINGIVWMLWADQIVLFLFGENWRGAVPYFKVFAFFGAVQGIYFLSGAIMQGSKQYKAQALITLFAILLGITYCLLIPVSSLSIAIILQVTMVLASVGMIIFLAITTPARYEN